MAQQTHSTDCCPRCTLEREWLRLRRSRLLNAGGLQVYDGLMDPDTLDLLLREALARKGHSDKVPEGLDHEQVRGGTPVRQLISVAGGPVLAGLYRTPALHLFIAEQVGLSVRPCAAQATYSIYSGAGAGLGIHRDVPGCDLALIVCLYDNDPLYEGGCTEAWPQDLITPLDELRAGASSSSTIYGLSSGQSMLLHGGMVPHRIRETGSGRFRAVALMCFEAVA
jgi:hypothetical protein